MFSGAVHTRVLRICCFLFLLVCGIIHLQFSIQEQQVFSDRTDQLTTDQIRSARLLTYYAKQRYMFEADMGAAMLLLQQALIRNPYYVPAWLSLVELNNDLGKKQHADTVLQYVDLLSRGLKRWRWDKALVAYQLGKVEMLPDELSYIIREIPGKSRNDALQLAFTLWEDPGELIKNVRPENITHLLNHAVRKKQPQHALFFWRLIEAEGKQWQEQKILSFLEMLLQTGEVLEAGKIWRKHFNSESIMYNNDFSDHFLQRAFGWRGRKDKAFALSFGINPEDDSARIMHYRFKGWDNLSFHHLYQIVPIEGGKQYKLTADLKSQKLTTDQRPFLEVKGYKCNAQYTKSEMVGPDQDWTPHEVIFGVPKECAAVVIGLRRHESRHIDNKLAGQMWLRNFNVTETGEDFTVLDELPK